MKQSFHSRLAFFIPCLCAGLLSLFLLPLSNHWFNTEKKLFSQEATLTGDQVQLFNLTSLPTPPEYLICTIDDDPEGIFNQGIYHPVDLAVTINNLKRLGSKHLFLGTHLHWPNAESQDNNTINSALSELDSCIISTPLKRTASKSPLPDYLAKSSIPLSNINGNTQLLPEANRASLAPTFHIPPNTIVGFSQLESEAPSHKIPLLARWGDQVILSSLLLERLHHIDLTPNDIKVTLGQQIDLIGASNYIPIDEFGYFSPQKSAHQPEAHIVSTQITQLKESPVFTPNALITASGVEADSLRAIDRPLQKLAQLTSTPHTTNQRNLHRIPFWMEIAFLAIIAALLAKFSTFNKAKFSVIALVFLIDVIVISLLLNRFSTHWMPISHLLILITVGWITRFTFTQATPLTIDAHNPADDNLSPLQSLSTEADKSSTKSDNKKRISFKKSELKRSFKRSKNNSKFNKKKN